MASNAPNTESAVEQTSSGTGEDGQMPLTPVETTDASPAPARTRKVKGATETRSKETPEAKPRVRRAKSTNNDTDVAAKPAKKTKKSQAKTTGKTRKTVGKPAAKSKRTKKADEDEKVKVVVASEKPEALDRDALLEVEAVRKLIEVGEEKGNVDRMDLRTAFESERLGEADLDGVLSILREHDITLARTKSVDPKDEKKSARKAKKRERADEDAGSVDPVRVYLREMGQVSLLTREGEVEIAQRIEQAVGAHFAALVSNP